MSVSLHRLGWSGLLGVSMLLLFIGPIGTTNSWYVACARLPFVGGMNAYLPQRFGRLHPRFGTPHHSMLLQTFLVLAFLGLSQAGSTARQTYDFLIRSGILLATVPYLYIFGSYVAAQRRPAAVQTWLALPQRASRRALGLVGMTATISAIGATLVPDADDPQPLRSTFKLVFSATVLFGTGAVLYGLARLARRQATHKAQPRE